MADDTPKKTANPFAELDDTPPPPRKRRASRQAIEDAGKDLGFTAPPNKEAPKTKASKPAPKKAKPVKPAPQVNRLRSKSAEPTVPFSQRISAETANGFYDYARNHDIKMKDVLERAYKALMQSETET